MASIGNLVVNLTAKTDKFRKGMADAQQTVHRMAAATAALGAIATARLAAVGDLFDKMSLRTGASVEELSRFKFAAEQSGSSIQVLEKGLKTMSVLMLNNERGMSTAVDTMNELGVSAEQLAGQSQTQRFGIFADAINNIRDPAMRTAQAVAVFGRAGAELLPLIKGGADAMRDFSNESDALGNTVSRAEATLGADLTDAFNRFKVATDGAFRKIAFQFGPAVVKVITSISHGIAGVSRFARDIVILGFAVIAASIAMKGVTMATRAYASAAAIAQALSGPAGWKTLAFGMAAATVATVALNSAFRDQDSTMAEAESSTVAAVGALDDLGAAAADADLMLKRVSDTADRFQRSVQSLESPVDAVARKVSEFRQQLEATQQGIVWDNHPLVMAMRQKESGFTSMLSNLQNELKVLRGEATETGIKLAQMTEMGVDPAQVEKLRKLFAERDKILAQNRAAEEWRQKVTRDLAERNKKKTPEKTNAKPQQFAGALQKGSAEAFSLAVRSTFGGKDSPVKEQKKTNGILRGMAKVLKRQRERDGVLRRQGAV